MENELVGGTGKHADSAAAEGVAAGADAFAVGDDLVVPAGKAVSLAVEELVGFALADAGGALEDFAGGAGAALVAVVDEVVGAD